MGKSADGNDSGPAPKRQKTSAPAVNARSDTFLQKRAQIRAARSIPAQPADAALKDGALDLQAFVEAHQFEIKSLEQSMATSKAVGSSRAFQQVPRGLRRRTASHNPKKVPRRLRARAEKERKEDNAPLVEARRRKPTTTRARIRAETAKRLGLLAARKRRKKLKAGKEKEDEEKEDEEKEGKDAGEDTGGEMKQKGVVGRKPRPKIRRNALNEPAKPPAKFRRRQLNKTWLPTHIWHAKRASMTSPKEPLWRFAMPLTPNEKIYRPTHRAQGDRGAVVWDTSYTSTIGLYGNAVGLERVLRRFGVSEEGCWNGKGKKWRLGTRSWTGMLSREKDGHRRPISPSVIFWNPQPQQESEDQQDPNKAQRQVFIRVHPSAFLETFNELLRLTRMENPRLWVEDLRFEIGSIEITGPASTEILLSVLRPFPHKDRPPTKHEEVFLSLNGSTNPAALPSNALLSFSAEDPRLRYPPRRVQIPESPTQDMELLELMTKWPVEEQLGSYAIFDRDARHQTSCLPSQSSINRRKSNKTAGTFLRPTTADHPIPVTLLATRSGSGTQTQGSWTLLAPWKCILPFWYSIVHTPLTSGGNPRFAGLNESMQVAFERGMPWFPADFLGTDAGVDWELEQRRQRRVAWERRPKSKRVEWPTVDLGAGRKGEVGDGLACDFEFLFGMPRAEKEADQADNAMEVDEEDSVRTPEPDQPSPLKLLNHITKASFNSLLSSATSSPTPPANAVINVRISLLSRGVVTSCARIYRLPRTQKAMPISSDAEVPATIPPQTSTSSITSMPHDLRAQWLARLPSATKDTPSPSCKSFKKPKHTDLEARKRLLARELITEPPPTQASDSLDADHHHPLVPDVDDLVGFVTSGSYCLSEGRGAAMGCLALDKVLPNVRENPKEGRLCVVRNAGESVGWIARWNIL